MITPVYRASRRGSIRMIGSIPPGRAKAPGRLHSVLAEERHDLLIEALDEAMLVGAGIGAERLGALDQDLVGIAAERDHGLGDELVERHGLLGLAAIHQIGADP